MLKLCLAALLLSLSVSVNAGTRVTWDYDETPVVEGFRIYCEESPAAGSALVGETDDGAARVFDLTSIEGCVQDAVKVEVWATAFIADQESQESNHIRFTPGADPIIIEIPAAPRSLHINFN